MQISEAAGGAPAPGAEPCRFPKLEECAHFHYERVHLPPLAVQLQTGMDQSLHSQHTAEELEADWYMVQVTSGDVCWLVQRNLENFKMLDAQLHQCIYDRKISRLPDLNDGDVVDGDEELETVLTLYLERLTRVADNSLNCGPVLNWLQMDNRGHRLLVPSEESRSINTPAVAAAYSVRRYVSQARDELNLEVGDMISVIDMASPGESMWWRGKRGFQVGFFPQHCVHIIGDKVPRNMPLPPPVVGSLALTPTKPVLRRHGKLITFFRSFILNRPSRRRLKQSGILKERLFGCDLGEHLLNSGQDVPMVLKCCADFIEANGIVDGIYRLSGITSNIQKLRNAFDEDRIPNLHTEDILQDIHSVASLLKMYFRELPNPLCTYQLYQSFVNAVQGCSIANRNSETDHERLLKMREAVQKLPPPHYRTLEYLMRHLARVAKHGSSTGMTTRNVAIVWAPNLLRCEALEVGGVAALQGVGVQAVVTEFLICYADLIFCDRLPNLDNPTLAAESMTKKCRPNSLSISTPTKLITLEEARSKRLPNKTEECGYIEVGGGPKNLPKKYHTIIELPSGARKRGHPKRSPLGWRLFFPKSRNNPQGSLTKNRKSSTPITISEKSVTESDLTDMKRKLRSVKSAESLTSGHSEPAITEDVLGPLHCLNKPSGHNRSVSHDSYFDTLQSSQNNSEGSLLDLSEIQLNFELEESEMRIFSEDESLVSSPRVQKEAQRRILTRARPEEFSSATNSVNPSPKKQARVVMSPESLSRKRTRLEDQLSDIQYIDCNTPDNVVSTTAVVHTLPESPVVQQKQLFGESYRPKNKSPRSSECSVDKRQSLNFEPSARPPIPKSLTEADLGRAYLGPASILTTPTPDSPGYDRLGEGSSNTSPEFLPGYRAGSYRRVEAGVATSPFKSITPTTPNYENVLTTINIIYKSPPTSVASSPVKSPVTNSVYENVILNPEKAVIPTSVASLPIQEASQPGLAGNAKLQTDRPKSLSALEDLDASRESTIKANLSSDAVCNTSEHLSVGSLNDQKTLSSDQSLGSNVQYTASPTSAPYYNIENSDCPSPTDLSLSEVADSSAGDLTISRASLSFPPSPSKTSPSPNVSPMPAFGGSSRELLTGDSPTETKGTSDGLSTENLDNLPNEMDNYRPTSIDLLHSSERNDDYRPASVDLIDFNSLPPVASSNNEKRKSDETECPCDSSVYQQVKYFRRSIHEVNALLDLENGDNHNVYENLVLDGGDNVYEDVELKNDGTVGSFEPGDQFEEIERPVNEVASENLVLNECSGETLAVAEDYIGEDFVDRNECLEENFDSLEPEGAHVYENVEVHGNSIQTNDEKTESALEQPEQMQPERGQKVRDLIIGYGAKETAPAVEERNGEGSNDAILRGDAGRATEDSTNVNSSSRVRKFYEKDSLPPCLRARNLKHQLKARSLDEEEFNDEFGLAPASVSQDQRRKSLDCGLGHKTNSLPKTLNLPKSLPDFDGKVDSIHLTHSTENVGANSEEEEQKKRERIERYKEERRRVLQDKYRSESFKEDKEVLLTRLRIFKHKDDGAEQPKVPAADADRPPRTRRKSALSDDSVEAAPDSLEEEDASKAKTTPNAIITSLPPKKEAKMGESLKSRAAIFEISNQRNSTNPSDLKTPKNRPAFRDREQTKQTDLKYAKNLQENRGKVYRRIDESENFDELDFIRNKRRDDDPRKEERRRHTFESKDRDTECDRLRRVSLESRSPKKERTSPTYCIKDMKAIFESKSKQ